MSFGTSLSNWVVMLVFLLGLVSNANAQTLINSTEDFERNDFSTFPWEHPGDASWTITSYEKNSGTYSAQAGTIDHDERATLRVILDCISGDITFYRKVSSESGFDYLKFFIDGVEKGDWSGEQDWAEVSFPVDEGTRTFEWTYSKDGSVSEGDDTAWIDDIVFPAAGDIEPAEIPFKRGVNLTNWLQASSVRQIQFTKFTKQELINIKSLGCDVIRLPINLHSMTNGQPDYTIDPLFYYFLDQIIDWAEELELHLILDNHTFDPSASTDPDIGDILVPVWMQMAEHYKDRSTYIYYEVLNEPHGISDRKWNEIQQKVIDAIRAVDQKHTIIVGPAGWNSYNNLKFMPRYEDDNLIYTFHFYDPFVFTHQGASWPNPSLVPLAGVPFPYYAGDIPACPPELENTWISNNLANYRNTGTPEYVRELIDIAVDFQTARDVPLFCGEFGVLMLNSNDEDRIYWYNVVRSYLEQKGIAWTIWDYKGGFGLFEHGTNELFDYDLNIPLVEALGLNAPPQQEFILVPDVSEFNIYMDHIAPKIIESSWLSEGILDFYSEDNPAYGNFCIHWTGVGQYSSIAFRFSPVKDLSLLVDRGFAIDFWIRCDIPDAKIDIRFIDTKTEDPVDHPWRMRYTIDRNVAVWDNEWNHLQIPLNAFSEHGSWDNGWFNPIGAYDWTATKRFDIVSEHSDLVGIHFYFDDIRVVNPGTRPVQSVESSLVYEGIDGHLVYGTYANEGQTNSVNTIPDFSHCGYMGGGVAIPDVPLAITLFPENGDDTEAIQGAIDYVSSLSVDANGFCGAVLLTAGRYQVSSPLTIMAGGVVLRGQGQDILGTVLEATGTYDYDVINMKGSGGYSTISSTIRLITSPYVPTGACSFDVENTNGYSVGDWIIVQRTPNQFWIDDLAMGQYGWTPGSYSHKYERYVVDIIGNTIMIDSPIVDVMEDQYGGGRIYKSSPLSRLKQCGVENLRIESTYADDTDESHPWHAVVLQDGEDCWVRKVTAQYFARSCVKVESESTRTTIEDCAFLDPKSILTGTRRYSFDINANANHILFQRCYANGARHSFVTGSRVPGPNVFVDCYAHDSNNDCGPHHRWAAGTLFDNVYDSKRINVRNRGPSGTGHGWAGAQQVLWNCETGYIVCEAPKGAMNFAIGCSGTRKDGSINEPDGWWEHQWQMVTPRSLYYRQLEDRLGLAAVENVTTPEQRSDSVWSDLAEWVGNHAF